MQLPRIGLDLTVRTSTRGAIDAIKRAEQRGVPAIWSTVSLGALDTVTMFAAAAVETEKIHMGTAIVPTYPRHPGVLASQTMVLNELLPNRFRLGIGPSHRPRIEQGYGLSMGKPLAHLREYLTVLRGLLWEGSVDFQGEYYSVKAQMAEPAPVPIYVSALRPNAFRLAGQIADGAVTWLCPVEYIVDVAMPNLKAGAESEGRSMPRLVAHVPVVLSSDREEVRAASRPLVARYAQLPFYANMFAEAGYPSTEDGSLNDTLLDHLIVSGEDSDIEQRLAGLFDRGIDEIMVMLIPATNFDSEEERISQIIAGL